jgi:hypothetical protein
LGSSDIEANLLEYLSVGRMGIVKIGSARLPLSAVLVGGGRGSRAVDLLADSSGPGSVVETRKKRSLFGDRESVEDAPGIHSVTRSVCISSARASSAEEVEVVARGSWRFGYARLALPVALVYLLSACSGGSGTTATTAASGTDNNPGGGGQVVFNVTVDFTGDVPVQGAFVDDQTGSGFASCAEFATTSIPGLGWIGPQPANSDTVTEIGGTSISYLLEVASYDGPGTYTDRVFGSLQIGDSTFTTTDSTTTVTVNADGSGNGAFTDFNDIGSGSGTESGTISWTCSD